MKKTDAITLKALTLEEVTKITTKRKEITKQYHEKIKKQLEKFDNEIYRIRKGKIAYQPSLLTKLLALATDLQSEPLIEKVNSLIGKRFDIEIKLNVVSIADHVYSYECMLESKLTELTPSSLCKISFYFNDKSPKLNLLDTIETQLTKELNKGYSLLLFNTVKNNEVTTLPTALQQKIKQLGISVEVDVKSIEILPNSNVISLGTLTKVIKQSKIDNLYTNNVMFNKTVKTIIIENVEKAIMDYVQVRDKLNNNNETKDTISQIKIMLDNNKNYYTVFIELQDKPTDTLFKHRINLTGSIQLSISETITMSIYLKENLLTYTITDKNNYFDNTLFEETYEYSPINITHLNNEINSIYEKAKVIADI